MKQPFIHKIDQDIHSLSENDPQYPNLGSHLLCNTQPDIDIPWYLHKKQKELPKKIGKTRGTDTESYRLKEVIFYLVLLFLSIHVPDLLVIPELPSLKQSQQSLISLFILELMHELEEGSCPQQAIVRPTVLNQAASSTPCECCHGCRTYVGVDGVNPEGGRLMSSWKPFSESV